MALHPQSTRRNCSVMPMSIWMSHISSTVWLPIGHFWLTQAHWQVAGELQLHCLSRMKPFIPCVCTFTYLSLLRQTMSSLIQSSLLFSQVQLLITCVSMSICDPVLENLTYCANFVSIHRFRLVTGILSILSFVNKHKEQSLSFLLVHIWSSVQASVLTL